MASARLKVTHWMAVVAGVAIGLTLWQWRFERQRRAEERYRQAYRHAAAAGLTPLGGVLDLDPRRRDYHRRMRDKWLEAARHPWASVAPDPPEPP